ncbi:MAG: hypothetical protein JRN26_00170 [Nitrososphaerota archaeon]|jgi:hypothetical protein|nr:hypothetical protein [Nitrososphaerota archaeon]MDG6930680.1 hypothetical protein [Nitrososphaerota archaeon]MDG6933058.1 hypothetical protein [Nitrososphaerota archaeon]MDG6935297.1 hypothetical protein [Nitrososphaerota archaeon]MDG6944459.1 hypothetical protein [Nitrososphaerota archaeon]
MSLPEEMGIYGAIILVLSLLISAIISLRLRRPGKSLGVPDYANIFSNIVVVLSGGALIIWDVALQITAFVHWLVLLVYLSLIIILSALRHIDKMRFVLLPIAAISAIMVILMLADIFLNLPVSSYYNSLPGFGVSYLLGFGQPGTASIFWVSLTFVLVLAFSVAQSILSLLIYIKK